MWIDPEQFYWQDYSQNEYFQQEGFSQQHGIATNNEESTGTSSMCPRGLVQKKTYAIVLQGCKIDPKYAFDFDLDLEEYLAFARISEAHKKNRGTGEGTAGTYYPILT